MNPYKKSRPAPLNIPHFDQVSINPNSSQLTADFNEFGLQTQTFSQCMSVDGNMSQIMQPPMQNNPFLKLPTLNNAELPDGGSSVCANICSETTKFRNVRFFSVNLRSVYFIKGVNNTLPHQSSSNIGSNQMDIVPDTLPPDIAPKASLSSFPARVALPAVPAAYQNIDNSYWEKHKFESTKQAQFNSSYNPYFAPNSAPLMDVSATHRVN